MGKPDRTQPPAGNDRLDDRFAIVGLPALGVLRHDGDLLVERARTSGNGCVARDEPP
jgi:hypothetical protein